MTPDPKDDEIIPPRVALDDELVLLAQMMRAQIKKAQEQGRPVDAEVFQMAHDIQGCLHEERKFLRGEVEKWQTAWNDSNKNWHAECAYRIDERDEARGKAALNERWAVDSEIQNAQLRRERDAALAQVSVVFEVARACLFKAYSFAGSAKEAEIKFEDNDAVLRAMKVLKEQQAHFDHLEVLDRIKRQERAEGRKEAAELFHSEIRKGSLALEAEGHAVFADRFIQASALVRDAILAAAEKKEEEND